MVHDNPGITTIWHQDHCVYLERMGYAQRVEMAPNCCIWRITDKGLERAQQLGL
jgi:hypothetical protein